MNLLANEQNLIKDNYFRVWDIVKLLYDAQLPDREDDLDTEWSEVGLYLGHHSFDRKLQLFKKDDYYNVIPYEFYPPYQPISNLIQRLKYEWLIADEKSIRTIEEEVNCYYWLKKDIYNFKPIMDLGIIERSYLRSSLEVSQPDKATKNETDLKEEIEQLKKQLQEKKTEIEKLKAAQQNSLIDQIFDESETSRYAPDLAHAIKLWEHIYINTPKDNSHTNKANQWISNNTGYDKHQTGGEKSIDRIREITTPFAEWGNQRNKNYKK